MHDDGDVAVIGAGLAGLAAARHLHSRGRRPIVFEATGTVGGRQRSSELGGTVLEEGAVFFGTNYPNLWRCLRAAGLADELKTYETTRMGPIAGVGQAGVGAAATAAPYGPTGARGSLSVLNVPEVPAAERRRLARLGLRLAPRAGQLRHMLGRDVRSPWLRRLDDVRADRWFDAEVGPRTSRAVIGPILESLSFAGGAEWSALGALMLLTFSASPRLYAVRGGNDRLARWLAGPLEVHTGASVHSLGPDRNGVSVEVEDSATSSVRRFRDVVLAVPGPVAATLVPGRLGRAIAAIRYSASVVPAIVTEAPLATPTSSFWEDDGTSPFSGVAVERPLEPGPILCFAAARSPWREDLLDADDHEAVELLARAIEAETGVWPEPIASKVIRWHHSIPVGEPGMLGRRQRILDAAAGVAHLELAGDYLVSPSQEGALVSGVRAARRLL